MKKKRIQKQNILAKLKKVSLTALTAQNGQHMIYMFSNVAYRASVYKTVQKVL